MRANEKHEGMVFSQQCWCACSAVRVMFFLDLQNMCQLTQISWLYRLDYRNHLDPFFIIIALHLWFMVF